MVKSRGWKVACPRVEQKSRMHKVEVQLLNRCPHYISNSVAKFPSGIEHFQLQTTDFAEIETVTDFNPFLYKFNHIILILCFLNAHTNTEVICEQLSESYCIKSTVIQNLFISLFLFPFFSKKREN